MAGEDEEAEMTADGEMGDKEEAASVNGSGCHLGAGPHSEPMLRDSLWWKGLAVHGTLPGLWGREVTLKGRPELPASGTGESSTGTETASPI